MTQGKWWSWYAYEDDDTHVMHVEGRNHNTGVLQPWITVKGFVTTVTMNDSISRWKTKL